MTFNQANGPFMEPLDEAETSNHLGLYNDYDLIPKQVVVRSRPSGQFFNNPSGPPVKRSQSLAAAREGCKLVSQPESRHVSHPVNCFSSYAKLYHPHIRLAFTPFLTDFICFIMLCRFYPSSNVTFSCLFPDMCHFKVWKIGNLTYIIYNLIYKSVIFQLSFASLEVQEKDDGVHFLNLIENTYVCFPEFRQQKVVTTIYSTYFYLL